MTAQKMTAEITVSADELVIVLPATGLATAVITIRDGGVEYAVRPLGTRMDKNFNVRERRAGAFKSVATWSEVAAELLDGEK